MRMSDAGSVGPFLSAMTSLPLANLAVAGVLLATLPPGVQRSAQLRAPASLPIVRAVDAPAGTEALAVEWVKIAVPGPAAVLAAVARPSGGGPFPVVILLHGTHGFAREYVQLAQALSRGGLLAIAACWFEGGGGPGARFVTPIACPGAPGADARSNAQRHADCRSAGRRGTHASRRAGGSRQTVRALAGRRRCPELHPRRRASTRRRPQLRGLSQRPRRSRGSTHGPTPDPARHGRRTGGSWAELTECTGWRGVSRPRYAAQVSRWKPFTTRAAATTGCSPTRRSTSRGRAHAVVLPAPPRRLSDPLPSFLCAASMEQGAATDLSVPTGVSPRIASVREHHAGRASWRCWCDGAPRCEG